MSYTIFRFPFTVYIKAVEYLAGLLVNRKRLMVNG